MNEVWVVFRGQIVAGDEVPESLKDLDQIVEVVKAEKISKSFVKLIETPVYHPNVSYGDVLKVVPSKQEFNDKIAVVEFSGIIAEEEEEEDLDGLGTKNIGLSSQNLEKMMNIDKQAKPAIIDKHKQGLVYEPIELVSHGSYKINIAYEVENKKDLNNLKDYFSTYDAIFRSSWNKKFGSVGFSKETKFEKAVKCLEEAPSVVGCFIAFNPKEFPNIDFSEDLIPKKEEGDEE